MTGRVVESKSAISALALIFPIALIIMVVLTAWPLLFLLIVLGIIWTIWQKYQWQKWSSQVNPFFNEVIQENQGCLTPMDLSLKANLTGRAAERFLEKKAEEYGAVRKILPDQGIVYYFLTASTLGRIFEDSEPIIEPDEEEYIPQYDLSIFTEEPQQPSVSNIAQLVQLEEKNPLLDDQITSTESEPDITVSETEEVTPTEDTELETSDESDLEPDTTVSETEGVIPTEDTQLETSDESESEADTTVSEAEGVTPTEDTQLETSEEDSTSSQPKTHTNLSLRQAELAKRLDLHSSTIGKHKSDPDFPEWSKSRDPEGIAWQYLRKSRVFKPVNQ